MLRIFSYVSGPSVCLLGEGSVQMLCPFLIGLFVFLEWSRVSSLYILEIKPLSKISLANMYFPYSWFPFHFTDVFFSHAEAFYFDEVSLYIPSFMSLALGDISVKILLHGISQIFLPIFSSRTLMVSQLIFKSFIHLQFIFCMV